MKKKKIITISIVVTAVIVASIIGVLISLSEKQSERAEKNYEMTQAVNAMKKAMKLLDDCQRLNAENRQLYTGNSYLSNPYSDSSERVYDYERRVKVQNSYKLNDYYLECAQNKYDEGFDLFSRGEWKSSKVKFESLGDIHRQLEKINYQIRNFNN